MQHVQMKWLGRLCWGALSLGDEILSLCVFSIAKETTVPVADLMAEDWTRQTHLFLQQETEYPDPDVW